MRRPGRPRSGLKALAPALGGILDGNQLQRMAALAALRRAWPGIVGPMMAAHSEPENLEPRDDGGICLWIAVDHPMFAQQIRLLRDDIRRACFRASSLERLTHIRSRVRHGAGMPPAPPAPKPRPVPLEVRKTLARELACVKDRRLRRAMFRARVAQVAFGGAATGQPPASEDTP
ncbi:MAG: DciA family protein [Mariprofundaceae bacterium]